MNLEQKFKSVQDGEPNFHIIKNDKSWLCRIQMNGELTLKEQLNIIFVILNSLNLYFTIKKKIKEKLNSNDSTGNN